MTTLRLALRGLVHRRRTAFATAAGAALATAVLVAALGAGDSVRASLRAIAASRLGRTGYAIDGEDRYFRTVLAADLASRLGGEAAALVAVTGTASARGGEIRVPSVRVLGVGLDFAAFVPGSSPPGPGPDEVFLNEQLARRLGVTTGDEVLLRMSAGSTMPVEAPLAAGAEGSTTLRLAVAGIVSDADLGGFSLRVGGAQPLNAFVSRDTLSARLDRAGRANMLLLAPPAGTAADDVARALEDAFTIDDAGIALRGVGDAWELSSERVFIEPAIEQAALAAGGQGRLAYFVDRIRAADRTLWYSFVSSASAPRVPADLRDDEIVLNDWAARELGAVPGDSVDLAYRIPGAGGALEERTASFTLRSVVPIEPGDLGLMPSFPGFEGAASCREWDPGVPLDLSRISRRDEDYWDSWGGSPRAFVTLAAAQKLWANRFGRLTAVRFAGTAPSTVGLVTPRDLGLSFVPIRADAMAATSHGVDFGQLFLGLGFFLVAAALALTALLSLLSVDQRASDLATLAALGWTRARIRALAALEGAIVALVGGCLGVPLGIAFHRAILAGLRTAWHDAVRTPLLLPRIEPTSLAAGFAAGFLVSLAVIVVAATGVLRRSARYRPPRRRRAAAAGVISVAAVASAAAAFFLLPQPTAFFASGALLLVGLLAAGAGLLAGAAAPRTTGVPTLAGIGFAAAARRRARSLAVAAVLACGIFIVTAVAANRIAAVDPERKNSGTGGFGLFVQTSLPVPVDRQRRLATGSLDGAAIVGLRVLDGDDASCLNLNRVVRPGLLAVDPSAMAGRFSFTGLLDDGRSDDPWKILAAELGPDIIPGFVDASVMTWGLGLSLGDEIAYLDEDGAEVKVRLVGSLANSVFQGSLVVAESALLRHFPSTPPARLLLVQTPSGVAADAAEAIGRSLATLGVSVESTAERLARFDSVQGTYLAIFAMLGWLGLLVGTLGLAVVVARNVAESRGELALLRAVGFDGSMLFGLVLAEHLPALGYGLAAGALASIAAVYPAARLQAGTLPVGTLALQVGAIVVSALLWTVLSAAVALRGELAPALREE